MKTILLCVLVVFFSVALPWTTLAAIVVDNFNSYTDGSILRQASGWEDRVNGIDFIVQGDMVFEGAKALYINAVTGNVIIKEGIPLPDGNQTFYFKTKNRSSWAEFSRIDFRVMQTNWDTNINVNIALQWDGRVDYVVDGYPHHTSLTFNDNEWTCVEIEWRSSDPKGRCRINGGPWTDWFVFSGGGIGFTAFDYVGIGFSLNHPSPGACAYFDALGYEEPTNTNSSTWGCIKAMFK